MTDSQRSRGFGAAARVTALAASVMDLHVRMALQEVDRDKRRLISGGLFLAIGGTSMLLAVLARLARRGGPPDIVTEVVFFVSGRFFPANWGTSREHSFSCFSFFSPALGVPKKKRKKGQLECFFLNFFPSCRLGVEKKDRKTSFFLFFFCVFLTRAN